MEEKTRSELLFEQYLVSQGITTFEFEKAWPGIPTHPDYTVKKDGVNYVFDVKEFKDEGFVPPEAGAFG